MCYKLESACNHSESAKFYQIIKICVKELPFWLNFDDIPQFFSVFFRQVHIYLIKFDFSISVGWQWNAMPSERGFI